MKNRSTKLLKPALCLLVLMAFVSSALGTDALPPAKAGTVGQPVGKIAFIRDGAIWTMNANGSDQTMVCEITNGDGRISWALDNKQIVFTRSGMVDLKGPDMLGGKHKVYDLFISYPDSAANGNRMFWHRITNDLGNRGPECHPDGKHILFWKDMNANLVNAEAPNYQLCMMEMDGSTVELFRKDWQTMQRDYMIAPTMNAKGEIAFVYFKEYRPIGMALLARDEITTPMEEVEKMANRHRSLVAPSWSPDGKWIATVSNDLDNLGLFLLNADLSEKYLVTLPPPGTYIRPVAPSFSPDSKWITFGTTDGSVWIIDITGKQKRRLTGPGPDENPAWSR